MFGEIKPHIYLVSSIETSHKILDINKTILNQITKQKETKKNINTMKTTTKMYLTVMLSTACIMVYQYQLSKASFMTLQGGNTNNINGNNSSNEANEVLKKQHKINQHYNIVTIDENQNSNAHKSILEKQIATELLHRNGIQNNSNSVITSINNHFNTTVSSTETATSTSTKSNDKIVIIINNFQSYLIRFRYFARKICCFTISFTGIHHRPIKMEF